MRPATSLSAERPEWREGKVRPLQGNSPHDRPLNRDLLSPRKICDDPFSATLAVDAKNYTEAPQYAFLRQAESIWSDVVSKSKSKSKPKSKPNPGAGPVPPPVGRPRAQVKETRREDHVPPHRPQMSSGRLFLDRVARQQSPSPLHRQPDHKLWTEWQKGIIIER